MIRPRTLPVFVVALVLSLSSLYQVADARRKETSKVKVPARVHFSANFEGELEPCG